MHAGLALPTNPCKRGAIVTALRLPLLFLLAPPVVPHRAPPPTPASSYARALSRDLTPRLDVQEGASPRVVITCPAASHVETDGGVLPFGGKPLGRVVVAQITRRDATITCVDDADESRGVGRLGAPVLRSVSPRYVEDAAGTRVVVTLEGTALGPLSAADDGLYLVWPASIERLGACPEAHAEATRVVACATETQVRGRGPARLRLQSAGRLEEAAGAPLELGALVARGGR